MKTILYTLSIISLVACSHPSTTSECPPDQITTGKQLRQVQQGDSLEWCYLNDTLWFEISQIEPYEDGYQCYIKSYRTNGLLAEEGLAYYWDHPVSDMLEVGIWKYYDCAGNLDSEVNFDE